MPAAPAPHPTRRHPTDLTDPQWCLLAPLLPAPRSGPGRPGRPQAPTAAVIDSQSVRASDWIARATKGYDAAKKVHGRKRHVAVDTGGLLLEVLITPASTQDRDGGRRLLWRLCRHFPTIRLV